MGTEKTIYFICAGTSSYDIINSINNTVDKKGGGFFSFFEDKNGKKNNKLEKDDFPKLENNGIKEIYMCQDNKYNMELFKNYSKIYTSMDYSNIESSIVFSSSNTKKCETHAQSICRTGPKQSRSNYFWRKTFRPRNQRTLP